MSITPTENKTHPIILLILDGWGYSEAKPHNAILAASTPSWDQLWKDCPHTLVHGSGKDVGLPQGQMGNSEVGHLNLGAGRVVFQEFTRIDNAIENNEFTRNPVLNQALNLAQSNGSAVHIMGLLSPGGVHSHELQIHAMVKMAAAHAIKDIHIHAFLDGRDTAPKSAAASIAALDTVLKQQGSGRISSIIGRYFAMDRDNNWQRVEAAYQLIAEGMAEFNSATATAALTAAYERGETDEFVQATTISGPDNKPIRINDGDIVLFMNFRADRARLITRAFIEDDFSGFERRRTLNLGDYVCLTQYKKDFAASVAFPPQTLTNVLGAYLADHGRRQLRIAETEKYAHVTFFFNGGEEQPFAGEDRILIKSPQVATYDLKPEMHAPELTDKLIAAIRERKYDVIICNYANPDMVGHTGNFDATVQAIEAIDQCLSRIVTAVNDHGGELLITADHGNAEQMVNPDTGEVQTAHTSNPVPFIYLGRNAVINPGINHHGTLSDVAPTILHLLGMTQPAEMTGQSIITLTDQSAR